MCFVGLLLNRIQLGHPSYQTESKHFKNEKVRRLSKYCEMHQYTYVYTFRQSALFLILDKKQLILLIAFFNSSKKELEINMIFCYPYVIFKALQDLLFRPSPPSF